MFMCLVDFKLVLDCLSQFMCLIDPYKFPINISLVLFDLKVVWFVALVNIY